MNLGGDYESVIERLNKAELIQKFLYKFLDDKSFALFEESMAKDDYSEAFRGAHTVKGICQNFSFTRLYESCDAVVQAMKAGDYKLAKELTPQFTDDYWHTIHAIEAFKNSQET